MKVTEENLANYLKICDIFKQILLVNSERLYKGNSPNYTFDDLINCLVDYYCYSWDIRDLKRKYKLRLVTRFEWLKSSGQLDFIFPILKKVIKDSQVFEVNEKLRI